MDITEISQQADWNAALTKALHHDFYHTWDFHRISSCNGEGDPLLLDIHLTNGGILFPLLAREIPDSSTKDLTSVYGYPSPLPYGDIGKTEIPALWDGLTSYLFRQGYISLFSRTHPVLTGQLLGDDSLQRAGRVVLIRLDRPEEEQLADYRPDHRATLRKLRKLGVQCQWSNDEVSLRGLIENYEATMRYLAAAPYYFFPERYYRQLLEAQDFETRIYSCTLDGITLCSGIFVFCGEFVQFHLSGTAESFRHLAPTKLMLDTVRRDASQHGCKYFCLGGGHSAQEDSLFLFKSGFSSFTKDFHLIRKVIDHVEYQKLSKNAPTDTHYFPAYRAPKA